MKIYNMERRSGKTELLIQKCINSNFEYPIIVLDNSRKRNILCRISAITGKTTLKNTVFTINEWFNFTNRGNDINKILIDDIEYMLPIIINRAFGAECEIATVSLPIDADFNNSNSQ